MNRVIKNWAKLDNFPKGNLYIYEPKWKGSRKKLSQNGDGGKLCIITTILMRNLRPRLMV